MEQSSDYDDITLLHLIVRADSSGNIFFENHSDTNDVVVGHLPDGKHKVRWDFVVLKNTVHLLENDLFRADNTYVNSILENLYYKIKKSSKEK